MLSSRTLIFSSHITTQTGRLDKEMFDETSLNKIRGTVRTILNNYVDEGFHNFIMPNPQITIPSVNNITAADKAANIFKQCTFKATLRGAIHMIEITGTLGN